MPQPAADDAATDAGDIVAALAARIDTLTAEVARLQATQQTVLAALRARDVVIRHPAPLPAASFIELGARDSYSAGSGIQDIGWEGDVAYRWTGPGHDVVLRVWLDRTVPIHLEVALFSHGDPRNQGAVGLTVDGTPVALAETDSSLLRSAVFPQLDASLFSEIVLHVPFLSYPPAEAAPEQPAAAKRGGRRARDAEAPAPSGPARGIAFTHFRFLAAA